MCANEGDATIILAHINADANAVAACLNGNCPFGSTPLLASGQTTSYGGESDGATRAGLPLDYTDNGDGTITDNNTGLQWEKKSNDGTIHDKDTVYTWCADTGPVDNACDNPGYLMDGTVKRTFLAALNTPPCFARHCDWRLPNVREMLSIVNHEIDVEPRHLPDGLSPSRQCRLRHGMHKRVQFPHLQLHRRLLILVVHHCGIRSVAQLVRGFREVDSKEIEKAWPLLKVRAVRGGL